MPELVLDGSATLPEEKQRQTLSVVRASLWLLELQLDAPKRELWPSVQKLMAQVKDGDCERKVTHQGETGFPRP